MDLGPFCDHQPLGMFGLKDVLPTGRKSFEPAAGFITNLFEV